MRICATSALAHSAFFLKECGVSWILSKGAAAFTPPSEAPILSRALRVQQMASMIFHALKWHWCSALNFSILIGLNTQILIHEAGHRIVSYLLFTNPSPSTTLSPFWAATTKIKTSTLNAFGKRIGAPAAKFLLNAAGAFFTLTVSAILLSVGLAIAAPHPILGKYLITTACLDFFTHTSYALSALTIDSDSSHHDFLEMAHSGLHPYVATLIISSIPITIIAKALILQARK